MYPACYSTASVSNATTTLSSDNSTVISTGTVISFPSITATNMSFTSLSTSTIAATPSVNSEFTFVTQSSLFLATTPSSSVAPTVSNPDEPTASFTVTPLSSAAADSKPTQAPLPSNIPLEIFPATGSQPGDPDLVGYSEISILFDSALNWKFVVQNSTSSSQIFAWMTPILLTSLTLASSQVKTWKLMYFRPDDYTGPEDIQLLQTKWLGWIPSDSVDDLAQQLKVTSSAFYTALPSPYKDLAAHVVSSFPVVDAPGVSDSSGGSSAATSSGSSSSKTRENAIIGVVSSLGAIALLILAFLVFRAVKQRRELAHRRLSDPHQTEFIGAPPEDHEFDRDSVGGQRRRSFYYAADSLRGAEQQQQQQQNASGAAYSEDPFNPTMRERRPPIGAPILRDSTMNW
ncbi:hypothetical protein C8Q77DRAFT_1220048 [Trametes polyzona]|nr:hypothetical protein C8Q77DRAFT_1220048 [Trametes polyzona]